MKKSELWLTGYGMRCLGMKIDEMKCFHYDPPSDKKEIMRGWKEADKRIAHIFSIVYKAVKGYIGKKNNSRTRKEISACLTSVLIELKDKKIV